MSSLPQFSLTTSSLGITSDGASGFGTDPTSLYLSDGSTLVTKTWTDVVQSILNLSAVEPNPTPTQLVVVDNVLVQDATPTPTRVVNIMGADPSVVGQHLGVTIVDATTTPNPTITDLGLSSVTYTDNNGNTTSQTWQNIIAGGGGSQNIEQVLITGSNANGQSITGLTNVDLSTINGSAYPPSVPTPNINDVLTAGNNAGGLSITGINNIDLSTINNLAPTTIGLTWSSFSGSNAYGNLPSSSYVIDSTSGQVTTQSAYAFNVFENSTSSQINIANSTITHNVASNEWLRYDYNGGSPFLRIGYNTGAFPSYQTEMGDGYFYSQMYSSGTGYRWEGRLSMEADNGFHIKSNEATTNTLKNILLEGNDVLFNGSSIIKQSTFQNGSTSWSIGSGGWNNITSSSFSFPNAWSGTKTFQITATLNSTNSYEPTGAMYVVVNTGSGGNQEPYANNSTYPTPAVSNANTYNSTGGATAFNFTDIITLTQSNSASATLYIYIAHNGGTWTGGANWTITFKEL